MSCYHPIKLYYAGTDENGVDSYLFSNKQGRHFRKSDWENHGHEKNILVPCRKCIGCRLDYSRRWADRLMLELDHSKTSLFFTLTYDNDHVTPAMYDDNLSCFWYTLVKKDLQDFNKRLRWHFADKEIRFFAAGEYGDKTLRPHYHGIYFGLSLDDFPDLRLLGVNTHSQPLYSSDYLQSIWKNGHVSIGRVSWQSCAYVARYNLKKLNHGNDDVCIARNCIPEFALMSRNPGIGGYFPIDHPEVFENPTDKIFLSDEFGVKNVSEISLPSYIFKKLELVNPELYAIIKEQRKENSTERFLFELSQTDLDEFDYLNLKEASKLSKSKSLVRNL